MQEQPKDEQKAIPCPKCGGNMLMRGMNSDTYFTQYPGDNPMFRGHSSDIAALICDKCGYAEIYATNPQNLRD